MVVNSGISPRLSHVINPDVTPAPVVQATIHTPGTLDNDVTLNQIVAQTSTTVDQPPVADNAPTSSTQLTESQSHESEFQLPSDQRRKLRRGNNAQASSRIPVQGTGNTHSIQAASNTARSPVKAVYIGQLSDGTSVQDIRSHLREIGVSHVSDIMQLSCRVEGQSSFCVSVDSSSDEDKLYSHGNWPAGARVRPYRERPLRASAPTVSQSRPQNQVRQRTDHYSRSQSGGQSSRQSQQIQNRYFSRRQDYSGNQGHHHRDNSSNQGHHHRDNSSNQGHHHRDNSSNQGHHHRDISGNQTQDYHGNRRNHRSSGTRTYYYNSY